MGQEIHQDRFDDEAFEEFNDRLRDETRLLKQWFDTSAFEQTDIPTGGLEVEAWLVDQDFLPAPRNNQFLQTLDHPLVVPELSRFNFEINTEPHALIGDFLSRTATGLSETWLLGRKTAHALNMSPMTIGILPTVRDAMLQVETMSDSNRYKALNDQLFRQRDDKPIYINIQGEDDLSLKSKSLMIEAACTSIQIHLQINQSNAKRLYNASLIASAPLVAATANAPFLYGKSLWAETRIPTFEQAVPVCGFKDNAGRPVGRVTLGTGYVRHSLFDLFTENLKDYPTLLPAVVDRPPEDMAHVRLQNGTLWRWNRPIIGFNEDRTPHLRIEHRTMAAGPTITDMMANTALYFGLALALGDCDQPPEDRLPFETCRSNFYSAARDGLDSEVTWFDKTVGVQPLLLERLLPDAKTALEKRGLAKADLDFYFDEILYRRILTGRTGTNWQRAFVDVHGPDFQALTARYNELQEIGQPIHEWEV